MISTRWRNNCNILFILWCRGQRHPYYRAGSERVWNKGWGGNGSGFFRATVLRCCSYYQLWDCGFSKEVPYFSWLLTTNQRPPFFSLQSFWSLSVCPSLFTTLMSPLFPHVHLSHRMRWSLLLGLSLSTLTNGNVASQAVTFLPSAGTDCFCLQLHTGCHFPLWTLHTSSSTTNIPQSLCSRIPFIVVHAPLWFRTSPWITCLDMGFGIFPFHACHKLLEQINVLLILFHFCKSMYMCNCVDCKWEWSITSPEQDPIWLQFRIIIIEGKAIRLFS